MSKRHTFWIYIFILSTLILLVLMPYFWIFFTSPSSEARVSSHGPGFFGAVAQWESSGNEAGGRRFDSCLLHFASRSASAVSTHSKVKETAIYRVTAYCPCKKCCGRWSDGITASGHIIVKEDAFVAAPSSFAFGTMLKVPGYNNDKPVPVLDRGGAIKGNRLDVFFATHQQALNWGVKYLKVEVVK